jgi:hypothetical protein
MMNPQTSIRNARMKMIIGLVAATIAVNCIILLSPNAEAKNFFGNILRPITASFATGLAIMVVRKQGTKGIFGRAYAALAAGLILYFIAEVTWGYYSIGLGVEVPFPSPADGFWLAAYAPFGYGLFRLANLHSKHKNRLRQMALIGGIAAVLSGLYIYELISVSEVSTSDDLIGLAIGIAYPILDAILIVPALMAVLSAGRGYLTSIPWIFISWVFTVIADTIFGFTAVMSVAGELSVWNLFYNAAYLSMAAGMIWHLRYMIYDPQRMKVAS